MAGINETKQVVAFGIEFGADIKDSLADGKFTFADAARFLDCFDDLFRAIAGIDQVPSELKDLDEAEAQELATMVKTALKDRFDVSDEQALRTVEWALKLGDDIAACPLFG